MLRAMPRYRAVARAVVQRARNPVEIVRGYYYSRHLPSPNTSPARERPKGQLERYFDTYTVGRGIWKWRHYFDIYERHFAKFVGREVHLVEVGIFSGGSLEMWRHYFGDECRIYGVDIEPACLAYEGDGVQVFIGDQASPAFWKDFRKAVPRVDILIDDGGHEPEQQIATLQAMLPYIQPGGVYLCEDSHGAFQPFHSFVDGLSRPLHAVKSTEGSPPNPAHHHIASVHRYPLVTVIEKPEGPVEPFECPRHGTEWQPFL
jgi:cephalosporin hydroxylase